MNDNRLVGCAICNASKVPIEKYEFTNLLGIKYMIFFCKTCYKETMTSLRKESKNPAYEVNLHTLFSNMVTQNARNNGGY